MKLPAKIYAIRHDVTGKIYIGRSANVKTRMQHHLCLLRSGRHPVEDMQADFDKYGERFTLSILDEVRVWGDRVKEKEWQRRLNTQDRRCGYNYKDPNIPDKAGIHEPI